MDNVLVETKELTGWRKLFNYPPGTELIWWMIGYWNSPKKQVVALALFLVSFYILTSSFTMSIVFLISIYLHEIGHAYVFRISGIKHLVLLLFPLGAVACPNSKEENARSDQLSFSRLCYLLLAGPAVNVILMLIGRFVQEISTAPLLSQIAGDFILVNGLLAFGNLIPIWKFDAGQMAKLIFSSLNEHEDKLAAGVILFFGAGAILFLVVATPFGLMSIETLFATAIARFGWIAFALIVVIGVFRAASTDDPTLSEAPQSLTNRQVVFHILLWMGLSATTLLVFAYPIF